MNGAESSKRISFHHLHASRWGTAVFHLLQKRVLKWILDHKVKRDRLVLERIADQRIDTAGMCLGRFDELLIEHWLRLQQLYRGKQARRGDSLRETT